MPMSIYPQPNIWQCGPFALKHALLMMGVFADENEISRLAGTSKKEGTDEHQLERAARKYRCRLLKIRRLNFKRARRDMHRFLRRSIPVLICVDKWGHWITVARSEHGRYIVMDSQDKSVVSVLSPRQLRNRWLYKQPDSYDKEEVHSYFDLFPVVPRFRIRTRPRFSVAAVRFLRQKANHSISRLWHEYVSDLVDLGMRRVTPLSEEVLSLGEFLRRHETMIVQQVDHWLGGINLHDARKILRDLHFVADTLGMVIPADAVRRAIAGITSILTLWAAGRYGAHPIYVPPEPKRPKKKKKKRRKRRKSRPRKKGRGRKRRR